MVSHLIGGGLLARPKMNAGVAELATLRVLSGVEHDVGLAIVELAMLRLRRLLHLELGWFDEVRAELVSVTKAELEQVDLDEGHQYEARDGQVEHAESRTFDKCELHVPRALQAHNDVQNDGEQDVLLDKVRGQPEARPIEVHVEVAVVIEAYDPVETWRFPTAWMMMKITRKIAHRARPPRS